MSVVIFDQVAKYLTDIGPRNEGELPPPETPMTVYAAGDLAEGTQAELASDGAELHTTREELLKEAQDLGKHSLSGAGVAA